MEREGTQWLLWAYIAAIVLIPTLLLVIRLVTGEVVWYGWGWQMYS